MLYRKKAFESRIKGFSNPISIKGSLPVSVMLAGIFIVVASLITYAALTDYTRKIVVLGYLKPETGSVKIISNKVGQLDIEIANGALVTKDQLIATIRETNADSDGQSLFSLEVKDIEQAIGYLLERIELMKNKSASLTEQGKLLLDQHNEKIKFAQAGVVTKQQQLKLASDALERSRVLFEKDLIPLATLEESKQRIIISEQALSDAKNQVEILKIQTRQLELDAELQVNELEQAINTMEQEVGALKGKLSQANSRFEAGIFAPISGTITYSSAQQGEFTAIGKELFQITPDSTDLIANLLAPSSAIGFVKPNDIVQIRYAAFPYREHGVFSGTVISMNKIAQLTSAINSPIQISEPVYQIAIKIDQTPKNKSGQSLRLVSGMVLEASIIIDKKPLLLWLLDPVL